MDTKKKNDLTLLYSELAVTFATFTEILIEAGAFTPEIQERMDVAAGAMAGIGKYLIKELDPAAAQEIQTEIDRGVN